MSTEFRALGQGGSAFTGLETFPASPTLTEVTATSDEVTALCPVTGQPDWYTVTIRYAPGAACLESKSLKLYLQTFRQAGLFCEALAAQIAAACMTALAAWWVEVTVMQKARGGITLTARAREERTT